MRKPLTVADVMTRDVVSVPADTPFKTLAEMFVQYDVSAFPVTEEGVGLVGVVSETDLLHKQEHPEELRGSLRRTRRVARSKGAAVTARDLMTSPMVTIELGSTLSEAARLMAARDITRLVVTEGDWMAGIVTRSDLLRAFLDSDKVVQCRVRDVVAEQSLWDDPAGVEISVHDGVVQLTGQLQNRSRIPVAVQTIAGIDGVTGVENRLTYAFDDTVPASGPFY